MERKPSSCRIQRIVSGGQTGVDRGALDAAIAAGVEHGGWCPRGRRAEDGPIPRRYRLRQTKASSYRVRTEQNVVDSDGTLILYRQRLTGGTELTRRLAEKYGKPCLAVDLEQVVDPQPVGSWLEQHGIAVLNVAGPRESSSPGITRQASDFVAALLGR